MTVQNIQQAVMWIWAQHAQKVRFAISGVTVAFVSLVILYVLTDILHFWYLPASILAFVMGVILNYALQKSWTFRNKGGTVTLQLSLFFVTSLVNLLLNTMLMFILVDMLNVYHIVSQALIMVFLAVVNFTIYRTYIFREGPMPK